MILFDSTGIGRLYAIERQINMPWRRASTTAFLNSGLPVVGLPSYS